MKRRQRRPGIIIWELVAASALLAVLTTVCLQFLRAAAVQRRAAQQRIVAIQETENLMERLSLRAWEELSSQTVGRMQLSPQARQVLIAPMLRIEVDQPVEKAITPPAKRITIRLDWQTADGQPTRGVRLVAWRYQKHA